LFQVAVFTTVSSSNACDTSANTILFVSNCKIRAASGVAAIESRPVILMLLGAMLAIFAFHRATYLEIFPAYYRHCEIHSAIDQLQQQGIEATLKSVRTDTAVWLSGKEYAWNQFPQDDARNWARCVKQVGYTGSKGFFVNHIIFAAIACMYNCDLTIIQSFPDETHAFTLLSAKSLADSLTDTHYDETAQ